MSGFQIKEYNTGLVRGTNRWRLGRNSKLVARVFGFASGARWCREFVPNKTLHLFIGTTFGVRRRRKREEKRAKVSDYNGQYMYSCTPGPKSC